MGQFVADSHSQDMRTLTQEKGTKAIHVEPPVRIQNAKYLMMDAKVSNWKDRVGYTDLTHWSLY